MGKVRWCGWCMLVGVAMFAIAAADVAAQVPDPRQFVDGPGWATWFALLSALCIALIGAYAKGLDTRIKDNRAEIAAVAAHIGEVQRSLDRDYHSKQEMNEQFAEIKSSILAIHRRLDFLRVPHAPLLDPHSRQPGG